MLIKSTVRLRLLLGITLFTSYVFRQQKTFSDKITSTELKTLAGATMSVKVKKTGISTSNEGSFSITIPWKRN